VSANEELVALLGEAEGGRIPLLAAESGDPDPFETLESVVFVELPEGLPQELIIKTITKIETADIFFIQYISGTQRYNIPKTNQPFILLNKRNNYCIYMLVLTTRVIRANLSLFLILILYSFKRNWYNEKTKRLRKRK
jgi:hypothetical protein